MGNNLIIPGPKTLPTYNLLDQIVTVLGSTNMSLWTFGGASGNNVTLTGVLDPYGTSSAGVHGTFRDATGTARAPTAASVITHASGVESLLLTTGRTDHVSFADSAAHSFGNATVDSPFSLGLWIKMGEALGTARTLMAKYDSAAGVAREYKFSFSATGKLIMELYDESADTTEIATSTGTAVTPFIWQFVTMTYDGDETAPAINLYINATSVHDGTSVESGAYVAMENTATPLLIAADGLTAAAANGFVGRIALPFVTGKELTAAEVMTIYGIGQRLLGLTD